jgi:hypothetical protein
MTERTCEYCSETRGDLHVCQVDHLHNKIEILWQRRREAEEQAEERAEDLESYRRGFTQDRSEIERQKRMRRSEREALAEWLDRRIAQQEQAMTPAYISHETKRVMEIEVAMLKRYREIIIEGKYRVEDPLMPRF